MNRQSVAGLATEELAYGEVYRLEWLRPNHVPDARVRRPRRRLRAVEEQPALDELHPPARLQQASHVLHGGGSAMRTWGRRRRGAGAAGARRGTEGSSRGHVTKCSACRPRGDSPWK